MNPAADISEKRRIQLLSTQLANQIAAGEVVERPASVVKELLENSIDAAARSIELEVEQGGAKLIRVVDDGYGIHPDDLPLATAPHATSKVYSQQELQQVASLGFRGEALASIASVSRFSIASRRAESEQGVRLDSENGQHLLPFAMLPGTRIEVRDLFFNTPARRKFLRSERTEYLHIESVFKHLALSRFDVGFKLVHNGRNQYSLSVASDQAQRARRVSAVLGKSFLRHALFLEFEAAGMRLWGWVGEAGFSRSQADSQYFYLNGRMIRDKLVTHAIRQAHQSALEPGRHPAYLLYLELDPQQVDINVHPTKHEVRFRESRLVHDFILRALQRSLLESPQAPSDAEHGSALSSSREQAPAPVAQIAESHTFYRQSLTPTTARGAVAVNGARYHLLEVVHGDYLLLLKEGEPGVMAVTPVRRLLLQRRLSACLEKGTVPSRPLLIPAIVALDERRIALLQRHEGVLAGFGVVLERLAEESVVLRQLPLLLQGVAAEPLVQVLCQVLATTDPEVERQVFLDALAEQAAPLLPPADRGGADNLLREIAQLLRDGELHEEELPWRTLGRDVLQGLFAAPY